MDYIKWSQEYLDEANKIQRIIANKKRELRGASSDERQTISSDIAKLRTMYYECRLTAEHLIQRAGALDYAA